MFYALGASAAVFSDARFVNFGEGAFEGGPEGPELLLPFRICMEGEFHMMCMYLLIYTYHDPNATPKNIPKNPTLPPSPKHPRRHRPARPVAHRPVSQRAPGPLPPPPAPAEAGGLAGPLRAGLLPPGLHPSDHPLVSHLPATQSRPHPGQGPLRRAGRRRRRPESQRQAPLRPTPFPSHYLPEQRPPAAAAVGPL